LPYGLSFTDGDTAFVSGIPSYASNFSFKLRVTDSSDPIKQDEMTFTININPAIPLNGDANASGTINVADIVYLIGYVFSGGSAPDPILLGDCNCDSIINMVDIIYLVNYIFRSGPPPCINMPDTGQQTTL